MSETPCMRRSFSHPSSSTATSEVREGDGGAIRALTESISFGRFVSDSLDWGKWSFFNSNRYLEEAEKFSKPGSVAQKTAFFEARYKIRASKQEDTQIAEVAVHSDSEAREVSMQWDEIKEVDDDTSMEKQTTGDSSVERIFPADDFVVAGEKEKDVLQRNRAHVPEELRVCGKEELLTEFINPQLQGTFDGMNLDSRKEKGSCSRVHHAVFCSIASVLNKSMIGPVKMTTDNKSNPLRPSYSRCSTIAETRTKPAAECGPFGLRSAERAQKRKEFFLKQQERITVKEAEKRQLVQRNQPPTARPSPPASANNLTSTRSCISQSRRRTAAPSSSHVRKYSQENASPNLPV